MLTYEIIVKYKRKNSYPAISWKQDNEPTLDEILQTLRDFAIKHNIPEEYLEDQSFIFVDGFENGTFTKPDIYMVDFSKIR